MTAIDASYAGAPASAAGFRTCRFTGLKVDIAAQRPFVVGRGLSGSPVGVKHSDDRFSTALDGGP